MANSGSIFNQETKPSSGLIMDPLQAPNQNSQTTVRGKREEEIEKQLSRLLSPLLTGLGVRTTTTRGVQSHNSWLQVF